MSRDTEGIIFNDSTPVRPEKVDEPEFLGASREDGPKPNGHRARGKRPARRPVAGAGEKLFLVPYGMTLTGTVIVAARNKKAARGMAARQVRESRAFSGGPVKTRIAVPKSSKKIKLA